MGERSPGLQFSLFGVPVRIEAWFFILPLFALQTRDVKGAAIWGALVFVGVMLHEMGHALAMRANGFSPSITLHGMGGLTHFPPGARPTPRQDFFITLAGPGAGLMLGVAALLVQHYVQEPSPSVALALSDAVRINIGWSIVNLLPILPWDGGLLLDSALVWATGKRHDRVVAVSSVVGGGLIIAFAALQGRMILGYFGAMGVFQGYRRWNAGAAAPAAPLSGGDEAKDLELKIRTSADPKLRAAFAEQLAWVSLRKGDFAGARRAVQQMQGFAPSTSLQARLAAAENDIDSVLRLLVPTGAAKEEDLPLLLAALIAKERFDDALELGRSHLSLAHLAATRLFEAGAWAHSLQLCTAERIRTGDGVHAYNEACCLCQLGRLDDSVTALQKAKTLGYAELSHLQTDKDLEAVRNRPEVQALLSV
jgi:Zn-dependent protease